jgi:hypothetical protein
MPDLVTRILSGVIWFSLFLFVVCILFVVLLYLLFLFYLLFYFICCFYLLFLLTRQQMESLHKPLIHTVRHPAQAVQDMGGKTLATLCKVHTLATMQAVIVEVLPLLGDTKSVNNRYGAALTLHCISSLSRTFIFIYIYIFFPPSFFLSSPSCS